MARQRGCGFSKIGTRGFPVGLSDETDVLKYLKLDPAQGYFVPIVAIVDRKGRIQSRHAGDDALFQDAAGNIGKELDALLPHH
ncbi:MAG: hypothetical protein ACR2I2_08480 [Bryobacteraceae bacterium]